MRATSCYSGPREMKSLAVFEHIWVCKRAFEMALSAMLDTFCLQFLMLRRRILAHIGVKAAHEV